MRGAREPSDGRAAKSLHMGESFHVFLLLSFAKKKVNYRTIKTLLKIIIGSFMSGSDEFPEKNSFSRIHHIDIIATCEKEISQEH